MKTAIWWIRRDLRLGDNPALAAALGAAENVVPVFILDPGLLGSRYNGEKRTAFLFDGLRALDRSLRERKSRLVVRKGDPARELGKLRQQTGAEAIFSEEDVSPYAWRRDRRIASELPLRSVWGVSFLAPQEVLKADGEPYTTFTPYSRAWRREAASRSLKGGWVPARLETPKGIESVPIPPSPVSSPFVPGEEEALVKLRRFARGPIYDYAETRNRLDLDGTSRLSPYLRFGMLSARRAIAAAVEALERAPGKRERKSADAFRTELIWREFYISILHHFPEVRLGSFRQDTRNVAWRDDESGFRAWCEGRTGYPVVDAGMRQLSSTGFMHNRARMLTAAFLTKHLLLDWRRGEEWFMKHLVDGDPAANNGGWQWSAGTGTDAAPYFRIFNPTLQGRRFDPEGTYVRRFVPELRNAETSEIHEPRKPIVSHMEARVRALAAFQASRRSRRAG
jgi:deoxyribodipyrimidine photo-lyase